MSQPGETPSHSAQSMGDDPPAAAAPVTSGSDSRLLREEMGKVIGKVLLVKNRAMNLYTYDPIAGKAYADTINRLQTDIAARFHNRMRISVLLAPTSVEFVRDAKLRKLSSSQANAIRAVYEQLNPSVTTVPVLETLLDHANEDVYFRTEHHWTATGAYYAYTAFMKARGLLPIPLTNYKTAEVTGFLGSLYAATRSKRLEKEPDTIVLYKPYVRYDYYVHYEGPLKMDVLDMSHATKKNKYRIFLSGDRPWSQISTDINNGLRIAVIKDSFGNALVPFLLRIMRKS